MSNHEGPIYEVTLTVERESPDDLDAWLKKHVNRMLGVPGILGADTFSIDSDDDRNVRVTQYRFADRQHLDRYLAGPATELRQDTVDRFGDRCVASRRVLNTIDAPGDGQERRCKNCNALLTGQYCADCGQRASSRFISLWELFKDAFGDLFELDSRLWQTIIPLAVRPGRLTQDYLRGRRARYMPPFRMYLVLSLAFFVIAFFNPREDLSLFFEPPPDTNVASPNADGPTEEANVQVTIDTGDGDSDGSGPDCDFSDYDESEAPTWFARRFPKQRLESTCERLFESGEPGLQAFLDKLADNVPTGLFVLLPLMAAILKLLYPLSRRYYAEHLLFVLHYHSFVFLVLIVSEFMERLTPMPIPVPLSVVAGIALTIYVPIYLFKSLRRVYGQGKAVTLLKFIPLQLAYLVGVSIILLFAALFAAFSP